MAAPLIRQVLADFRAQQLKAEPAAERLGLSRARFYKLYADYLASCAQHRESVWVPGVSGGDHAPAWPSEVEAILRKRLSSKPPASYSFAASEALRLCHFSVDRAQVRRWAIEHHLAHPRPNHRPNAPVKRWQRSRIGELCQLDASPHPWFPNCSRLFPMLNMLDDCSRVFTGSKIYQRELLLAYYDFLPAAFIEYGLPLEIYVDFHSLLFTHDPQAKGKVERSHFFWQERLPAYFASEAITDIDQGNSHIHQLRLHRNHHEVHRELKMKPQQAWNLALKEKRSVLRPVPRCPWWPFVWSLRTPVRVGADGRIPVGSQSLRIQARPGTKLILCHHPAGHHSVLTAPPVPATLPLIFFTHLPK